MSFEDEWAQLKADAAQRGSTRMQLNQHQAGDGGGGGGSGDLVVQQDDLGAVGHEAYTLHGRLHKQADIAGMGAGGGAGSSEQAATHLSGHNFQMGGEFSRALTLWDSKVKTVLQMCAHISNHLDYSRREHARDDEHVAASMRNRDGSEVSVSEISKLVG
jgi:hypothetical protein